MVLSFAYSVTIQQKKNSGASFLREMEWRMLLFKLLALAWSDWIRRQPIAANAGGYGLLISTYFYDEADKLLGG